MSMLAWKGHGTQNDFVLLPDLNAELTLSADRVRALCDRQGGIGADGVLRIVRTKLADEPAVVALADEAEFFMDYRNADGSVAEMCGNGVRVFAEYLRQAGLIDGATVIATRGGTRSLSFDGDAISVDMGSAVLWGERPVVTAVGLSGRYVGLAMDLPNPHVVVELESSAELISLDLSAPPAVFPPMPAGQNVEFTVRTGPTELRMRVHERGVGETRSCGTGICAAVVAASGGELGATRWQVDVPGGRCEVWGTEAGTVVLSGPAELVARIELTEDWLAEHP